MVSIIQLKAGQSGIVKSLPEHPTTKQQLLVHGVHVGGLLSVHQNYPSQQLILLDQNGRKLALRRSDCQMLNVELIEK